MLTSTVVPGGCRYIRMADKLLDDRDVDPGIEKVRHARTAQVVGRERSHLGLDGPSLENGVSSLVRNRADDDLAPLTNGGEQWAGLVAPCAETRSGDWDGQRRRYEIAPSTVEKSRGAVRSPSSRGEEGWLGLPYWSAEMVDRRLALRLRYFRRPTPISERCDRHAPTPLLRL
jgi:hypothetical protein